MLMKKLTDAYDRGDIYTLLSLELEWVKQTKTEVTTKSKEKLKLYNKLLKDQIKDLERDLEMVASDSQYFPIQRFLNNGITGLPGFQALKNEIASDVKQMRKLVNDLESPSAEKMLKELYLRDF